MPFQNQNLPENGDSHTVDLEIVRSPGSHQGRRPAVLNARRFVRICRQIQTGHSTVEACLTEGVTYRRLRQLCASRPIYQKRYEKAEQLRFQCRRERMEALVVQHAEQNWQAAIAWLERNLPQKWALKIVPRVDPEAIQAEPEIPREVLAKHRALMLEMARGDEAAAAQKQLTSNPSETAVA